jgi:Flp pilus assembly pilin Flp
MLWSIGRWWKDESGLGTVEMVLILAVLVGIALIFREYIFGFVADIMANIMGGDVDAIRSNPVKP